MKTGINWSVVTPTALRPKTVEKAVSETARLRELELTEKQALVAATADLERAEADDVATLAESFRSGREAKPRTQEIERLRGALREHERRVAAAGEAVAASEVELGQELQRSRESWRSAVEREADKERASCRAHLDELQSGVERLAVLRGISFWLGAEDLTKAPRTRGLGSALGSARFMANGEPANGTAIIDWARELIDPPRRPAAPVLRVPGSTTDESFTDSRSAPVEAA